MDIEFDCKLDSITFEREWKSKSSMKLNLRQNCIAEIDVDPPTFGDPFSNYQQPTSVFVIFWKWGCP